MVTSASIDSMVLRQLQITIRVTTFQSFMIMLNFNWFRICIKPPSSQSTSSVLLSFFITLYISLLLLLLPSKQQIPLLSADNQFLYESFIIYLFSLFGLPGLICFHGLRCVIATRQRRSLTSCLRYVDLTMRF